MDHPGPDNYWLEFIGEGRSGHTVIAAILDAHPNIRISEEQKWLTKWLRGERLTREVIFKGVHECGMGRERMKYKIPNSSQLMYSSPLLVMGDKCGWGATLEVKKRGHPPTLLSDFSKHLKRPIKLLHTIRNPFDNLASWYVSPKYKRLYPDPDVRIRFCMRRYARFYKSADRVIQENDTYHVANEELIASPINTISGIFEWLGVPVTPDQISLYSSVLLSAPTNKSKDMVWPENYRDMMYWRIIDKYPYLKESYGA